MEKLIDEQVIPEENIELVIEHIDYAKKLARQFYKDRSHFEIDYDDF